jgi:phosphonopyruvate decarboxylase
VLDGDGSLLMNLGSLVTIAEAAPPNLIHFVLENGTYEANGSHPTPGRNRADFAAFARAAGYRSVYTFDDGPAFADRVGGLLRETGPVFVVMKVEPGPPPNLDYEHMHSPRVREEFVAALAAPV